MNRRRFLCENRRRVSRICAARRSRRPISPCVSGRLRWRSRRGVPSKPLATTVRYRAAVASYRRAAGNRRCIQRFQGSGVGSLAWAGRFLRKWMGRPRRERRRYLPKGSGDMPSRRVRRGRAGIIPILCRAQLTSRDLHGTVWRADCYSASRPGALRSGSRTRAAWVGSVFHHDGRWVARGWVQLSYSQQSLFGKGEPVRVQGRTARAVPASSTPAPRKRIGWRWPATSSPWSRWMATPFPRRARLKRWNSLRPSESTSS